MLNHIKTRRLNLSEIFFISLKMFRKYFKFILPICLAAYFPLYFIVHMITPSLDISLLLDPQYVMDSQIIIYFLVFMAANVMFLSLISAAMTGLVKAESDGRPISFALLLDVSLLKWGKLVFTGLLNLIIVSLSSALIVPAVFFGVSFYFYASVIAISDKWGFKALTMSSNIIKGRWFGAFGFIIFLNVTSTLLTFSISMLIAPLFSMFFGSSNIIINVLTGVTCETLCSFMLIASGIWFVNQYYQNSAVAK